jgi:hypothetical protein
MKQQGTAQRENPERSDFLYLKIAAGRLVGEERGEFRYAPTSIGATALNEWRALHGLTVSP